jgi:hypothetical protein
MVVIASDYDRCNTNTSQLSERIANNALGIACGSERFENVTRQQHAVDSLASGDLYDLSDYLLLLV